MVLITEYDLSKLQFSYLLSANKNSNNIRELLSEITHINGLSQCKSTINKC